MLGIALPEPQITSHKLSMQHTACSKVFKFIHVSEYDV